MSRSIHFARRNTRKIPTAAEHFKRNLISKEHLNDSCHFCRGTGKISGTSCSFCHGTGKCGGGHR